MDGEVSERMWEWRSREMCAVLLSFPPLCHLPSGKRSTSPSVPLLSSPLHAPPLPLHGAAAPVPFLPTRKWISPSSVHWRTWAQGLPIGWASFCCCYKHPLEVSYTCTLIYAWFISCKSKYTQYENVVWHLLTQCVSLCTAFFFR